MVVWSLVRLLVTTRLTPVSRSLAGVKSWLLLVLEVVLLPVTSVVVTCQPAADQLLTGTETRSPS